MRGGSLVLQRTRSSSSVRKQSCRGTHPATTYSLHKRIRIRLRDHGKDHNVGRRRRSRYRSNGNG